RRWRPKKRVDWTMPSAALQAKSGVFSNSFWPDVRKERQKKTTPPYPHRGCFSQLRWEGRKFPATADVRLGASLAAAGNRGSVRMITREMGELLDKNFSRIRTVWRNQIAVT